MHGSHVQYRRGQTRCGLSLPPAGQPGIVPGPLHLESVSVPRLELVSVRLVRRGILNSHASHRMTEPFCRT